ncbi:MAG: hypothetical protein LBI34_03610 [Puniceicoccales bacterium]|jgi:Mor family transcriptional regulator|nr:hypothetical protein [Puniceicoccales bacterium]
MSIEEEMRHLEKEAVRIERRKEELVRFQQEEVKREEKLDDVFAASGYPTPLALVEALIRKFGLKVTGENEFLRKRKRTRVTSVLRDSIKEDCHNGLSMNRASKKYRISYAVVARVLAGFYDNKA